MAVPRRVSASNRGPCTSRITEDYWLTRVNRGLFTLIIGIASFWLMPSAPSKTRTKHRPNGYFSEREEKIIVNRSIRDDPGKVRFRY